MRAHVAANPALAVQRRAAARRLTAVNRAINAALVRHYPKRMQLIFDMALNPPDTDECVLWPGATRGDSSYGQVCLDGMTYQAHRLVLEIALGKPLGPKWEACHTCNQPRCYLRGHLYRGTHKQNMEYASAQGRMGRKSLDYGPSPLRKLSAEQVLAIRDAHAETGHGAGRLGKRFGITPTTIHQIIHGKTYKEIVRPHE